MTDSIDRRDFIVRSGTAALALGNLGRLSRTPRRAPADRVAVAVMGVHSRGNELAKALARTGAEVRYLCDVDSRAVLKTVADVTAMNDQRPKGMADFRRALEDASLDALVIAAPDHWHTPAALLGLQDGKHVYVEKPCGHNPREGELLVAAQRR